jgi:Na+(H+)/acetate symporter ActP
LTWRRSPQARVHSRRAVFPVGQGFDLSVINTSAGAFAATLTTNTGWTLAGSMSVGQNVSGYFVAAKTAAGAWTLYRGS